MKVKELMKIHFDYQHTGLSAFAITHYLFIVFGIRELRFAQANAQTKNCKRACFANADKNCFKKNSPTLQKNKNTPTHSPTNIADNGTKTQYLQGLQRHGGQKASR